jgi:hypothetical protein
MELRPIYRRAGLLGFGGVGLERFFSNSCNASVTNLDAENPVAASRRRRRLSVSRLTEVKKLTRGCAGVRMLARPYWVTQHA